MMPAWQAIQPDLVPAKEFGQAVALSSLTFNAGRAIGPALAGALVAFAGPGWAFVVNALSFVGVIIVLWWWRPAHRSVRLSNESLPGAVRAGLRYGANAPSLRAVLVRTACFAAPVAAFQSLLPTVVRDELDLGSGGYGILLGCFGIGAALAAIVRPRLDAAMRTDHLVLVATYTAALCLLIVGLVPSMAILAPALLLAGAAWTTGTVSLNVTTQGLLPWWVRARGLGIYMLVLTGAMAFGSAAWGAIADWSISGAYVIAAITAVIGSFSYLRWKLATVGDFDLNPAASSEPIVNLHPADDDGPVLITVSYRVPETLHGEFTTMMRRVERDRRRSGAREWGLFRDLADTDRFVETFTTDTWAEHLRQHDRRTRTADVMLQRTREFVDGDVEVAHLVSAYSDAGQAPMPETDETAVDPVAGDGEPAATATPTGGAAPRA